MQHLDEGTIHSWLDGALSADESARMEAHVKECPQCAAAVAEARGFVAASSRILTALDNAPRGVIPVAPRTSQGNWAMWRAAAAVLVVAVGSLMVVRGSGRVRQVPTSASDAITLSAPAPTTADGDETIRTTPEPAPPVRIQGRSTQRTPAVAPQRIARSPEIGAAKMAAPDMVTATNQAAAPPPQVIDSREAPAAASQANTPARENNAVGGRVGGVVSERPSPSSGYASVEPGPPIMLRGNVAGLTAKEARGEMAPLKVIGTPRRTGARVTLYEVAPGDTVTLTEVLNAQLREVVTTGIAMAAPQESRAAAKSGAVAPAQRSDAEAANAPDSQRANPSADARRRAPSAPAPVTAVEVVNGVTTITWPDASTGNVLKLSGRMPEARLQETKLRIERERAAAAAKKNP